MALPCTACRCTSSCNGRFIRSGGGSDWYVLHGTLRLADGGPLYADIALTWRRPSARCCRRSTATWRFGSAINTARKALDDKQLELLKSSKRQPVPVSSRCYSIRDKHFRFWHATPEQMEEFVARKVFWLSGQQREPVMIADPCDAQYLDAGDPNMVDKMLAAAKDLAARGMVELAGDFARATDGLLAQAQVFHATKDRALEDLHAKHAYERA